MTDLKVAAVILTLNETEFIEQCLQSISSYVDWMLVLDGQSTDNTVDIARKYANQILQRPFCGSYAEECNYAHDNLPPGYDWVLMVDADERFPIEFLQDMHKIIAEKNVDCFRFPRKNLDTTYQERQLNPQDHQVRLYNRQNCYWTRPVHSILWHRTANKRADQHRVYELSQYPIIHLKKPPKTREAIQARWDNIEKQNPTPKEQPFFYKI